MGSWRKASEALAEVETPDRHLASTGTWRHDVEDSGICYLALLRMLCCWKAKSEGEIILGVYFF